MTMYHRARVIPETLDVMDFPGSDTVRFQLHAGDIIDLAVMFTPGWDYIEVFPPTTISTNRNGFVETEKLEPIGEDDDGAADSGRWESGESDLSDSGTTGGDSVEADQSGVETPQSGTGGTETVSSNGDGTV